MAKAHGKNTVIRLVTATTPVSGTDVSRHCNTSEFNPTADVHDNTAYGADGHEKQGGLTDGTFTMGGHFDTSMTTGMRAVLNGNVGDTITVTRRPEGTGSGKVQDVFSGVLSSYTESAPVADLVTWAAEVEISGTVDSTPQTP